MLLGNNDLHDLKIDVLDSPPLAALPSNLSYLWLDRALYAVERVVNANTETDPMSLRVPLALVLHLLARPISATPQEVSDEQLYRYVKLYRFELAMEKLRRLGVCLTLPATEVSIFKSEARLVH